MLDLHTSTILMVVVSVTWWKSGDVITGSGDQLLRNVIAPPPSSLAIKSHPVPVNAFCR